VIKQEGEAQRASAPKEGGPGIRKVSGFFVAGDLLGTLVQIRLQLSATVQI
jgi:hypothetical protein